MTRPNIKLSYKEKDGYGHYLSYATFVSYVAYVMAISFNFLKRFFW